MTADMNDFATGRRFDRVVSVEMFEHIRNWPLLLEAVGVPEGAGVARVALPDAAAPTPAGNQ